MDIRKLQRAIVDGLEDVKAHDIVVFNTEHLTPLFERVIIATGTSNRQTKSLASSVRDAVKDHGFPVLRTEGEANGEWIIVDCGAAVVHVMQPSIREYYHLEEIWGDKPVNMKLGKSGPVRLVKAEEPSTQRRTAAPAGAKKAAARAPARRTVAGKPEPARKTGATKTVAARPAGKAKAPARKVAPPVSKAAVTRVVGVKRSAAKGPVAKAAVARRAAPAGKTAARKPAAKKSSARK